MNRKPKTPVRPLTAHFVTTLIDGVFLKHYIVIAATTSKAVSAMNLNSQEKLLQAREAVDYQLIMDHLSRSDPAEKK